MKRLNQYLILSFILLLSFSQLKSQNMYSKFSGISVGNPKIVGSTSSGSNFRKSKAILFFRPVLNLLAKALILTASWV